MILKLLREGPHEAIALPLVVSSCLSAQNVSSAVISEIVNNLIIRY